MTLTRLIERCESGAEHMDDRIVEAVAVERWLPVVGWEGYYEISDRGRVRSVDRMVPNGGGRACPADGKLLSPRLQMHGYLCVTLRRGRSVRKVARVHRLVATAFLLNQDGAPTVNHIDNDRANNVSSNLEWCTQAENLAHMSKQGRRSLYWLGRASPNRKLSQEVADLIRERRSAEGLSHQKLSEIFCVSKKTVTSILNGQTYLPPAPKASP